MSRRSFTAKQLSTGKAARECPSEPHRPGKARLRRVATDRERPDCVTLPYAYVGEALARLGQASTAGMGKARL